jgi:hypothetical protein
MPEDRTYLAHLLHGREALIAEIRRLTQARDELDALIDRIGRDAPSSSVQPVDVPDVSAAQVVKSRTPARRESAGARGRSGRRTGGSERGQKSIRMRVLEMLEAEDREFGLAEIIQRIQDAGIKAHDDAVRSITIKLMKDGTVERVGRGQYRLVRRGNASATRPAAAAPSADAADAADATPASSSYPPPLNLAQPWDGPTA